MKPPDAQGLAHQAPLVQVRALCAPDTSAEGAVRIDEVAEETAVALELNGVSQAVMMATPADLEDFALGFAFTEGWIDHPWQLLDVETRAHAAGIVLGLRTTAACEHRLRIRRRTLAGPTGCGLCGLASLEQMGPAGSEGSERSPGLLPQPAPVELRREALALASSQFHRVQTLHARCGGLHAAAWCDLDGCVTAAREDVGRHNALDKLIGFLLRRGTPLRNGFVLMSSRCSFELVQKARAAGIGAVACVSAPTAHAVRTAQACGVALWAFVREGRASRYA